MTSIYGGIYTSDGSGSQTIEGSGSGGSEIITQWTDAMPAEHVQSDLSAGELQLGGRGLFAVEFHVSFDTDGDSTDPGDFTLQALLNGSPIDGAYVRVAVHSALDVYTGSVGGMIFAAGAGDVVSVRAEHDSSNDHTFDVEASSLTISRVGV